MSGSVATASPAAPLPPPSIGLHRPGLTTPRAIALLLILFPTSLRILLINDPFPIWDVSPFKFPAPSVGIPPTLAMTLDILAILGAALALMVSGARVRLIEPLLLAVGAIVATMHALFVDGGSLDNLRIGSCWTAALAAGIGIRHLASDPIVRRWIFALVLGASMPLAIHSLVQVFVEHPATVAAYRANPSSFLDARGWTPGSAMARNYERRLMQPEATGWFGMANVHATFAAAFVVGWCGVVLGPLLTKFAGKPASPATTPKWKNARATAPPAVAVPIRGEPVLLGAMLLLAVVMLLLTRSKGGFAACALGLGLLAASTIILRRATAGKPIAISKTALLTRVPSLLGPAVMLGMISLITLRGLIGTGIGELSLLFRWFYISAATRIFAEQPLLGVGPADFRPAYELAKNPLSPEEVTSPHSLPFDWLSMLGVGGIAWLAIIIGWSIWLGRSLAPPHAALKPTPITSDPSELTRPLTLQIGWAFLIILLACLTAFVIELAGYADVLQMGTHFSDMAIVISQSRLPGLILWILATALLLVRPMSDALLRRTLGCIGLTLLASACIDVAPVWPNSAALFFVTLGLVCSRDIAFEDLPTTRERTANLLGAGITLTTILPMLWAAPRVMEWERGLVEGGKSARAVGHLAHRIAAIESGHPPAGDSLERWLSDTFDVWNRDWWTQSGRQISLTEAQRRDPRNRLATSTIGAANWSESGLSRVHWDVLNHPPTLVAQTDLAIERAGALAVLGLREDAVSSIDQAVGFAGHASSLMPPASTSFGLLGRALLAKASLISAEGEWITAGVPVSEAVSAFERAASLDPHGITYPLQLFELGRQIGDRDLARKWAEELLRRNQNMRLDPVRALTPEQVSRAEAALRPSP